MRLLFAICMIAFMCSHRVHAENCDTFAEWFSKHLRENQNSMARNQWVDNGSFEVNVLDECLHNQNSLDNDYRGMDIDNKARFLEKLRQTDWSDAEKNLIAAQFERAFVEHDIDCFGQSCVNTIHFSQVDYEGNSLHIFRTGWGDDDSYFVFVFDAQTPRLFFFTVY